VATIVSFIVILHLKIRKWQAYTDIASPVWSIEYAQHFHAALKGFGVSRAGQGARFAGLVCETLVFDLLKIRKIMQRTAKKVRQVHRL
jgi:hypothetical protein